MKKLLLACAVLASACQPSENIAEEAEAQTAAVAVPELTTTVTAVAPTTAPSTTTTTTIEVVEVTTTLPILCPQLSHPQHHNECPVAELRKQSPTPAEVIPNSGEWAIPTYIVMCESGGDWNAYNPSGASGPYQLMPMHFGGELAMYQSRAAQHAKAAELWNNGKGKSHWQACL